MAEVQVIEQLPATQSMVTVRLSDVDVQPTCLPFTPSLRSSRTSRASTSTSISDQDTSSIESLNWEGLEKTEEKEARVVGADESTALLLARLEQENAALAGNPKSALKSRQRSCTRPPSMHHLKNLVNGPERQSLRYSLLPPPPMTELEFWAALVQDYPQTAQRLPTLTSNKIRGGVPPPLRGVVWPSIAAARDSGLHEEFQKLVNETSPYEGLIGKDVGRSFPNVEMFKDRDGEGQVMLGRVLKAFSLYDDEIGYCQGLGFVVGPLLMHMSEPEAFCILVKLMEYYDLRSCYLPDLSGLHLRIYQFQALLTRHLPELAAHLESLKIEPLYVSQWFLSFFAVTCPLPMLLRIYDVMLAEGATETLMRVALSLMQRNETKLRAFTEFEDAMQFLLSRGLWDTYAQHADDLVNNFVSLTDMVSKEILQAMECDFKESQTLAPPPSLKSTASQLLGRFWAGSTHSFSKSANNLSLVIPGASLRKVSSGQGLNTAYNVVGAISDGSTTALEVSLATQITDFEPDDTDRTFDSARTKSADKDLHNQIEELLTAFGDMQRQQTDLARELQREREERDEDRGVAKSILETLQAQSSAIQELAGGDLSAEEVAIEDLITIASQRFSVRAIKRTSIMQSKHQLRDAASEWKAKFESERIRCQELSRLLDNRDKEHIDLKDNLREARSRVQEGHREKQRLERTIQDFRSRRPSVPDSPCDLYTPISETAEFKPFPTKPGLREFKLGRSDTGLQTPNFGKRSSSLNAQALMSSEVQPPAADNAMLHELASAKTAEAVARQELEETKGKLDALRRIISSPVLSPMTRPNPFETSALESPASEAGMLRTVETPEPVVSHIKTGSLAGGLFSGWGKRGI